MPIAPPFPYYGGKRRFAPRVWELAGPVDRYIEPFAGGLSILLGRPEPITGIEIVADTNGFVCNFWRAVQSDPEQVAHYADYPTIHQDLTARHRWLIQWGAEHSAELSESTSYYDAQAAGWWVWGISNWIGPDWCISNSNDKRPLIDHKSTKGFWN